MKAIRAFFLASLFFVLASNALAGQNGNSQGGTQGGNNQGTYVAPEINFGALKYELLAIAGVGVFLVARRRRRRRIDR